ncbi:hypothetical protein Scep_007652 [Stephania cephalantha]|uniref:Uncharacterized protein n=1 Tax=Stephania cephalantha TaxID=152367 RepID=A0AAP0KBJ6_9MAGN
MKGSSKLVMVATLITALSLTMVLLLILVLLAQLYCSLLRNRRLTNTTPTATAAATSTAFSSQLLSSPLSNVYAQGVLRAPRSFLFPVIIGKEEQERRQLEQQERKHGLHKHQKLHQCQMSSSSHHIGNMVSATTSPLSPSFISVVPRPPNPSIQEVGLKASTSSTSNGAEHFVYISNPIYDNEASRRRPSSNGGDESDDHTPFETPDTSPSRLETGGCSSSSDDEDDSEEVGPKKGDHSSSCSSSSPAPPLLATSTPPLTPMKKLSIGPNSSTGTCSLISQCCSSGTSSSSSCASPCTSPSW